MIRRPKIRRDERIDLDRPRQRRSWSRVFRLSRHLEEGARLGGRRVALLRSPALPFARDLVEVLLRCRQQIVQAVDLGLELDRRRQSCITAWK